jgi:DNA polymerase elongation subunit (family B)
MEKIKVRGLEIRKRDTPCFVFDAQTEMINALATANNTVELRKKIPFALNIVKRYRQNLLDGDVPIQNLIISKRMSKNPERYRQHVSQVIAAEQPIKEGTKVHAGNSVKFLFTHSKDKRHDRRVKAAQLIEKGVEPDVRKYLMLLYASAANRLSFEGYTIESICNMVQEQEQKSLTGYYSSMI